ncbi:solute carrier family 23 member 1-like [Mya arenaria]|uniref:solute carrier family 23 member 1-like n=1 Tax=Mya arenaria TaxID=6604 RepID=UPI0022E59EB6|nr:solute carrier family 23 member 1-like [Mya arenaria]
MNEPNKENNDAKADESSCRLGTNQNVEFHQQSGDRDAMQTKFDQNDRKVLEQTTKMKMPMVNLQMDDEESLFHYDVFENPPVPMTLFFAMQQVLMSLSRSLSTALLVADIVCARTDENFKARLLSTTLFISGVTSFLQNTIGIRLPLYQGPAMTYVVPLLAMSSLPQWKCPDLTGSTAANSTINITDGAYGGDYAVKVRQLEGSLMIAGAVHMLFGLTGMVGVLLRFIGPVTIIPALTVVALYIYRATTKFAKAQWGVAMLVVATAMVLSFYLRRKNTPIPCWKRGRGFYILWFPLHKMFAVLIACLLGWGVSAILTVAGVFSDDTSSPSYYARTDSRLAVIDETPWFLFPYPGQFGAPLFETGAFVSFMMGTISSIIDSIGDYYACAKVCDAPPPPNHAVNRGIAVEGMMSFFGGWCGAGHATSTFGGNIGAIGITRVASLRVFQLVGLIYIVFGIVGKIGAVFVTIPYSVVGGMMMINFGVLIGVMLSNMQFIDMSSTRSLAIIGMSMLIALMTPYWIETTDEPINTGIPTLDNLFTMLLANPAFVAGVLACFMDNTIPGSDEERGMVSWKKSLGVDEDDLDTETKVINKEVERRRKVMQTVYTVPYCATLLKKMPFLRFIPFYPKGN